MALRTILLLPGLPGKWSVGTDGNPPRFLKRFTRFPTVMRTDSTSSLPETPNLPTFQTGIHLLTVDREATGALQTIALDHALLQEGDVLWVDSYEQAQTTLLAKLAPSDRVLERIRVARAFTPFQHYQLLDHLDAELTETQASLVLLPSIDHRYREDDLPEETVPDFLESIATKLVQINDRHETPLIVTRVIDDGLTAPLSSVASDEIRCEITKFGPRFVGRDFETLVYPLDNGFYQTTLSYWDEILTARIATHQAPAVEPSATTRPELGPTAWSSGD